MTAPKICSKLSPMHSLRAASVALAFLLAVSSLDGCGVAVPPEAPASGPADYLVRTDLSGTPGGNLIIPLASDPRTFNRLISFDYAGRVISELLSSDLVRVNRVSFDLEPSLASRWELDNDGRTYTIHLRRGLRFSDGVPLTAEDVVFTFQVLQDPKINSSSADLLKVDGVFPTVTQADSHTIRLAFPRPLGMGLRTLDSLTILPRHRLLKAFQEGKLSSMWGPTASPEDIAGTGPFRLRAYQPGVKVVLERNPHYWKKDKTGQTLPYLDTLTFLIVPDRNAQALRFLSGELDLLDYQSVEPENFTALRRASSQGQFILKDLGPGLALDFLWFNLNPGRTGSGKPYVDPEKRAWFEKAQFRRAVALALDRPGMTRAIFLGLGTPQDGPVSTGNRAWHNDGLPPVEFRPSTAKELLAQLGLRDTDGDGILEFGPGRPFEFTLLTVRGNSRREKMVQVARENLARIGIRVEAELVEMRELIHKLADSFEYEAMLFGFTPSDVAPENLADLWLSSGSNHFWFPNQAHPQSAWETEIDQLTSRLMRSLDPAARKKAFFEIQEIWAREMPAIPTIAPNVLVAWKTKVGNVRPAILAPHLYWNAEELTVRGR